LSKLVGLDTEAIFGGGENLCVEVAPDNVIFHDVLHYDSTRCRHLPSFDIDDSPFAGNFRLSVADIHLGAVGVYHNTKYPTASNGGVQWQNTGKQRLGFSQCF